MGTTPNFSRKSPSYSLLPEPGVSSASRGDEVLGEVQGFGVLATVLHGGPGKDGAGRALGLWVILVAHHLEGIVYNAEGRYELASKGTGSRAGMGGLLLKPW